MQLKKVPLKQEQVLLMKVLLKQERTLAAAAFGGVGELCFSGYQGIRFGERVTVRAGRASWSALPAEEVSWLERLPPFQALDARIHERFDLLVGRESGPVDPRRSRWVVHPFTGRKVRVADDGAARE